MKLFLTRQGPAVELREGEMRALDVDWDDLFTAADPIRLVEERIQPSERPGHRMEDVLAPVGLQEVWAAGVTYFRSRSARMAESDTTGEGSFYDRVYRARRPELFYKGSRSRICGPGEAVRIRSDSSWSVPEPELVLAVTSSGLIFGYTIGNDVSARDIEGENPLYLPQAKVYAGSCALGPGLLLATTPLPRETKVEMEIIRGGAVAFNGSTSLSSLKRTPGELVDFLFRDNVFPEGCYLLTGTGIVPPDEFALQSGDNISITIQPIGTLTNGVQ